MSFAGFGAPAIDFLSELSRNNQRAWFEAHRGDFERALVAPAEAFVEALGPRLRTLDPKLQAIPRLNGSIKTLERRMRFPKSGLPPYKEYLDLWFWSGRRRAWDNSGFFLRLARDRLTLAAGMIEFQKAALVRYRRHVLDDARGAELVSIVRDLREAGYVVGGESYKKPPRGVPAEHPRVDLSKHGALFASLEAGHPKELGTPEFADFVFAHFSRVAKLHAWLVALRE